MIDQEDKGLFFECLLPIVDRHIVRRDSLDIHQYIQGFVPQSLYVTANELQDSLKEFGDWQICQASDGVTKRMALASANNISEVIANDNT